MAMDVRRIALTAAEAVLNELGGQTQQQGDSGGQGQEPERSKPEHSKPKKRGLSTGTALLVGAGVMTAGRAVMRARDGGMLDSLKERLANLEDERGGEATDEVEEVGGEADLEDEGSDEPEDYEEEEPEDYEDEEPEDYEEDEPEDYEEDEPEDYEDEEPEDYEEDEPEDYEDEGEEVQERQPSRASSGAATRRRRRRSKNGHRRDGTA